MTGETPLNLFQQQDANRRRTAWLIVCVVLFFAWLGFRGDYIYSLSTAHAPPGQDARLMTTLAALVGAVLLIRNGTSRTFFDGRGGGSRGGRKSDLGPLAVILLVVWIVSWILAPLITQLLAVAVSRKREYLADAMGARFTRNPLALARALEKIEAAGQPTTGIKSGAAHMCIADPLGRRLGRWEGALADVLATHPPMAKRIAILKGMGYAQLKREQGAIP